MIETAHCLYTGIHFPFSKDLENYMTNRPKARILRIESMGDELISLNIMTESVGSEVRSLTERWATLDEKVTSLQRL